VSGAPYLGSVDVYVTAGADLNNATSTFSSLAFGSLSSYIAQALTRLSSRYRFKNTRTSILA
jgi:hypothetical protein